MRSQRWVSLVVVSWLLTGAAGCVLTTGQFTIDFDMGQVSVTSPATIEGRTIDLNDIDDYNDHKEDLEGLADLAILGEVTNHGSTPVDVEAWLTPNPTSHATEALLKADPTSVRLWGPFHVGVDETKKIPWNTSAGLFTQAGKAALLAELEGDGVFTLYLIGASGIYNFHVSNGTLVLVLDASI